MDNKIDPKALQKDSGEGEDLDIGKLGLGIIWDGEKVTAVELSGYETPNAHSTYQMCQEVCAHIVSALNRDRINVNNVNSTDGADDVE